MPPKKLPKSQLRPTTRYRYAERTPMTRRAHAQQSVEWRRKIAEAEFPLERRNQLLELISSGVPVRDAAEEIGTTWQKVYGLAAINAQFSEALDEATRKACICGGQPWTRGGRSDRRRCCCPEARAWRARESQEYRARQAAAGA